MAGIKMIALDLDGTLFDSRGEIPPQNKQVLQEAHKKGIHVVLSSGRMTGCVSPTADALGIDCSIIVYNGAMVRGSRSEDRKLIFHKPLQSKYGDTVIDYSLENHFHLNFYLDDKLYAQDDPDLRKYAGIYSTQTGAVVHFIEDLREFKGKDPTKLIIITDPSQPGKPGPRRRDEQYDHFYPLVSQDVTLTKTNPEYLEFMNKEVDKGVGLKRLAAHYGIPTAQVIAFGDADNDAPMVAAAGIGVAMANATPATKKSANIIAEWDNNGSGVARVLKQYL